MRVQKQDVERRVVVEAYAKYDCAKTGRPLPNFAKWDWLRADAIDEEMCRAKLKVGIPAGYLLWDEVELAMDDLRECAVSGGIFPNKPRKLGLLENEGHLVNWEPDRKTVWFDSIKSGKTFDESAPMLLRPAVSAESPSRWYVEDGSGRAIAYVANQHIFEPSTTLAIAYLGRKPDSQSSFMRKIFPELLRTENH